MSLSNVSAFDEDQWRKPGELYRIRRFLASDRHPVAKACGNCRKMKVKCDANKPCTRCKNKKVHCDLCDDPTPADQGSSSRAVARSAGSPRNDAEAGQGAQSAFLALRDAALAARLERPVPYSPTGILFNDNDALREKRAGLLPHRMLRIAWNNGFAEKDFIEWFSHMTPTLSTAIDTILTAVETLAFGGKPPPISDAPSQPLDMLPFESFNSERIGYLHQVWDPNSQRRIAANCNNRMAKMVGLSREAGLALVGRCEATAATTPLRFMCHVLNGLATFNDDDGVLYARWSPGCCREEWDTAVLVRSTKRLLRDAQNRPNQIKIYYSTVSEEEFDLARQRNPDACEPYISEIPGVPTTSQELLNSPGLYYEESFAHMINTERGRAKMDALASVILRRFAGTIAAAEAQGIQTSRALGPAPPPWARPPSRHPSLAAASADDAAPSCVAHGLAAGPGPMRGAEAAGSGGVSAVLVSDPDTVPGAFYPLASSDSEVASKGGARWGPAFKFATAESVMMESRQSSFRAPEAAGSGIFMPQWADIGGRSHEPALASLAGPRQLEHHPEGGGGSQGASAAQWGPSGASGTGGQCHGRGDTTGMMTMPRDSEEGAFVQGRANLKVEAADRDVLEMRPSVADRKGR